MLALRLIAVGSICDSGAALFAPPTLSERRHRRLATLGIAVRRAILMVAEGQRSHPRNSTAKADFKNAANRNAVGKHVVVVAPFAGARSRCTFIEDDFHVSWRLSPPLLPQSSSASRFTAGGRRSSFEPIG